MVDVVHMVHMVDTYESLIWYPGWYDMLINMVHMVQQYTWLILILARQLHSFRVLARLEYNNFGNTE